MDISLGQVVISGAGRDKGKRFIIVGIVDESYVMLADGSLRKIEKPKRKKVKHLKLSEEISIPINQKLTHKLKISNAEIRKILSAFENENKAVSQQ